MEVREGGLRRSPPAEEDPVRFSVVVTVWKRNELLPHALQSVHRQSFPAQEVVVISDGRSRASRRIVEGLTDHLPIRYEAVRRRRKTHGNHLRRRGLETADGSHVVILGHDCLLYGDYLETHRRNLADDPDGLSVVPVDYWRETWPDGRQPRVCDVTRAGEGEVDLLCLALPRRLALEVGCFDESMMRIRCADFLSFDRLRRRKHPIYRGGASQAAHF